MRRVPTISISLSTVALTCALLLSLAPGAAAAQASAAKSSAAAKPAVDPALFQGMKWRNIGPFRGGRATAVAGVAQDPLTYYFGSSGGGVWKTEDAGTTWKNVSDGFFETGSVGALAVAPSDPNVVYAGMGEAPVRGVTTSHGDGVYRSTDAGRTWTHSGLDATEHVSAIAVDPRDPDVVFVAAQGSTWKLVLHVSDSAGASDLSMDPTNPRVIYAAFWDHERTPWQIRSGGPGSGVWKTTDGGSTWERLGRGDGGDEGGHGDPGGRGGRGGEAGHGGRLPELMGKVGVAVSPARPERVWAMVEADDGGLFRSDDAGKTWHRVNEERELRARAWYYTDVFADPKDPDTVWVLNAPILRSTDGGRTFHRVRQAHGDNHDLWINPNDPRYLVEANDGGAIVSTNGGETWSTENNQPTAQFYRVDTDDTFPFRVYGGQQDNSTVAIASAAPGGIGRQDWFEVGGCESAHVAFDPKDPKLVYAGCYQGMISEYDVANDRERQIQADPFLGLGADPDQQPYRFNWNAPIEVSPEDPSVIYHGANVLFETRDRGTHWRVISPDLTRNEKAKQGPGGAPITNESAGGEVYGTIFAIAPSPHDAGTIWVGSDDGLVHLTRDAGEHWTDVTPPELAGLPGSGEAQINAIDVSPEQVGKAYVAVTRYKLGDYRPLAFKTSDYGATWTKITDGIPDGHWVRVVREDPVRAGLLYAGTERGAYVSFDDGGHWQSLQLNLPVVPVTDLQVRQGDLVASTQGRAFWILDDLTPLRQVDAEVAGAGLYLYAPPQATRAEWGGGFGGEGGGVEGKNPPSGAVIDFVLSGDLAKSLAPEGKRPKGDEAEGDPAEGDRAKPEPKAKPKLELEIRDAQGKTVRTLSSVPDKKHGDGPGGGGEEEAGPFGGRPELLPTQAGMNRIVWDLRADSITKVPGQLVFGSFDGPRLPPGTYTLDLRAHTSAGDQEASRTLKVVEDPRIETSAEGYAQEQAVLARVRDTLDELDRSVLRERKVRDQVQQAVDRLDEVPGSEEIAKSGKDLVKALEDWEGQVVQTKTTNFQDIINFPNRLDGQIAYLYSMVDSSGPPVTAGAAKRADDLASQWAEKKVALDELLGQKVTAFNQLMEEHKVPAVVVPPEKETKDAEEASE
jgi:photosystem II stability/assembly factor-like uncharacterized protein